MNDFIPKPFDRLFRKGIENGDYFLKLCGAGGGGFMLGFTENWDTTSTLLNEYQPEIIYRY
jgi:mevalonate kinase